MSSSTHFHLLLSFKVKNEVVLSAVGHVGMFPPRASKRCPAAPRQPSTTVERAAQAAGGRLSDSLIICFAWSQDMLLSDSNTCTSQPRLEHNHTSTTVHPNHFTAKTGLASSLVLFSLFKIRVGKSSSPFFLWWRQYASFHAARRAGGQGKGQAQSRSHGIAALRGEGPNGRDAEASVGLESAESFIFF